MNKATRITTAIVVSLLLGGMFAYQDAQKSEPAYQQHPVTVVLTDFFCGALVGLIIYFGAGWLAKRKGQNMNKAHDWSEGDAHSGKVDDKFYDEVARELQEKSMIAGLWTKAFAEMDGDEAKTRALYIRYRVRQLADEATRLKQIAERQHESPEQKRKRETELIRNRFGYLRRHKLSYDEQIPNSQFEGDPSKLSYPVNASFVADVLGVTDLSIIIAIRSGKVTGVRCDGEWFVDLGDV